MTEQELSAIEERAKAATPDWKVATRKSNGGSPVVADGTSTWVAEFTGAISDKQDAANATFAAHARSDVPALVAEVRNMRRLMGFLLKAIDDADEPWSEAEWALFREARTAVPK